VRPLPKDLESGLRTFAIAALMLTLFVCVLPAQGHRPGSVPPKLAHDARALAQHGGVTGTCHGCATQRMQSLSRRLVVARFQASTNPRAVSTALCIVRAESGFNPGAISRTDDWSLAQINRPTHQHEHPGWWRPRLGFRVALFDPVFAVGVMWAMSHRGTSWSPWTGSYGRGICS
jgi:hypothetical protein